MLRKTNFDKLFSFAILFLLMASLPNVVLAQEVEQASESTQDTVIEEVQTNTEEETTETLKEEIIESNSEEIKEENNNQSEKTSNEETTQNTTPSEKTDAPPEQSENFDKLNYTWSDFVTQKDCREFVRNLNKNQDLKDLAKDMQSFCNTPKMTAWKNWLHTFHQEKKDLLIKETLAEKSLLKYPKVLLYLFVDIQNTNPKGNTPKEILDKVQQSIIDHQPTDALSLIEQLPPNYRDGLENTIKTGKILNQIKEQLNQLASSTEEASND